MTRRRTRQRGGALSGLVVAWNSSVAWFAKPRVFRTVMGLFISMLVCACAWAAFLKWSSQHRVRQVSVFASFERLEPVQLQRTLNSVLREVNWMNLDVEHVRSLLTSLSWVRTATVSKTWPDRVVIEIEEPVPMAVWNEQWIMTMDGELIEIQGEQRMTLPTLRGAAGRHEQVSVFYQSLSTMLRSVDLKVIQYDVTTALQWRLILDNGIELIAEQDGYVEKIRRFVGMYVSLQDFQKERIFRVDTRYENGVAVEWKSEQRDPV